MRDLNHDGSGLRHWVSTSWREVVNARIVRWAVRLSSDVVGYLWGIRTEVCWWTGIVAVHQGSGHGAIILVWSGAGFDLVAQDEVGSGVTGFRGCATDAGAWAV